MGFPIRKSADQSFFAAPRGLSQRSTSFIASQRQGIHRMPLSHLIALIINAHLTSAVIRTNTLSLAKDKHLRWTDREWKLVSDRALIRKTSLLRDRSARRAVKRAYRICGVGRTLSHCVAHVRNDLLFTMSDNTRSRRSTDSTRYEFRFTDETYGFHGRSIRRRKPTAISRWWSQTGSNRRPPACKAGALPTELWPRSVTAQYRERQRSSEEWWAWEDLNFRPHAYQARALTN